MYVCVCVCVYKDNLVISHRVPTGIGIMIPAPAPFNKWVFEFPIPIIHGVKCSHYTVLSQVLPAGTYGASKIDIPKCTPSMEMNYLGK